MSRLRVSLSSSPLDREIAQLVSQAEKSVLAALRRCRDAEASSDDEKRKLNRTRRDLERAMMALGSVHRTQPNYNADDLDQKAPPRASVDVMSRVIQSKRGDD